MVRKSERVALVVTAALKTDEFKLKSSQTSSMSFKSTLLRRTFVTTNIQCKKIPENLKGRSKSSQDWIVRQINDPYVKKAKFENYRARSAFKLIEIDDKYRILKPGLTVVECGAAPGAWTQVCVKRINACGTAQNKPQGRHIAIDILPMHAVEGATIVAPADFTIETTQCKVTELLNGKYVDVILSDMAPSATGIRQLDQESILNLAQSVLTYSISVSQNGGSLLVKLWAGGQLKQFEENLMRYYSHVKVIKPASSRQNSAEIFILATDFSKNKT